MTEPNPFNPDSWMFAVRAKRLPRFLRESTGVALIKLQRGGRVAETIDGIAKEAGVCRNSVIRHMDKLEAVGLLKTEFEPGYMNEYRLLSG